MRSFIAGLALLTAGAQSSPVAKSSSCLPTVDLGYEKHQALSMSNDTHVYKFQNIRYAQNPMGDLRFRAPIPPKINRDHVQIGAENRTCPQGVPAWQARAFGPISHYSQPGTPFDLKGWEKAIKEGQVPPIPWNADTTEDCLFLDVHAPKKVFEKRNAHGHGAPVLVWIHGGGYVLGSKQDMPEPGYYPDGLLAHAAALDDDMIFVALNYRLGALGFLAGSDVDANVGLLDQRLALQWVQDNIHFFGGSKDRVTVMGESGGGGSILLHMGAAKRGQKAAQNLFSQAIAQSPAVVPLVAQTPETFNGFLEQLNVGSLSEARDVDQDVMIAANEAYIGKAPTTTYTFGPVRDDDFAPKANSSDDLSHPFDKSINVMTSHNVFEGSYFFDPNVETEDDFHAWLERSINGLEQVDIAYLMEKLYPAQFDGSLGYVDQGTRQMSLWSEAVIESNFYQLGSAFGGKAYAYEFGIGPGFHIQDLDYTFEQPSSPPPAPKAKDAMQSAIASFVIGGTPQLPGGMEFPRWGAEGALVNMTVDGAVLSKNRLNETRCAWWIQRRGF